MRLTPEQEAAYVAEFERRFRERTPARDVMDVLPETRVGRGEMRTWFQDAFGRAVDIDDTIQLDAPLRKAFKRLRREFPEEKWS